MGFKLGDVCILVVIDIVFWGIDVDGVSYVINYDLFNIVESYVYCIGCMGRVGFVGIVIVFCDQSEIEYLVDIEKLMGKLF